MLYLWLILFGVLGALSRYSLECLIHGTAFPFATLLINVLGCFAITFFAQSSHFIRNFSAKWLYIISTGFIGSFTTLSAFLLEVVTMVHGGHLLLAAFYFATTMISGMASCWLGFIAGHSLFRVKEETKS
ncbi:CrcB family protein [Sporolactobacillus sp. STCC-11]|uniref:fluoride efflux transporter FluC n=1 Tax=Sporolactobacillus caesalpiniae TaxID=3230362 RepID=UPI0033976357